MRIALAIALAVLLTSARLTAGESKQVIVVFKTHFDIGYTDLAANVVQRYRTTMIDQALRVVEESRSLPPEQQFVWTIPGWPMAKIMEDWPGQTPQRKEQLARAFREGRFVTHSLPFTTHTETLEPEDLVRGMNHASRLARAAGLELPRDAKMTDVPCHSWIMPTLLRHAGVEFLHLGCNAASSSPRIPPLFWWEGPDGSRLLTMYSAAGYGTGLAPPADWPHRSWLAMIHTGDNHGPPTPAEVRTLLDEAKRSMPGVQVRIGRLSDFADAILAEKPDLPVIRGDMPDTWIHGPMCDPRGAALARNTRPALASAEALDTLLHAWGAGGADTAPAFAAAYEKSLLYGEHTWGGALYWITSYGGGSVKYPYGDAWRADQAAGRFKRSEASWDEHTGYIDSASAIVTPMLDRNLATLARSAAVPGQRIVVFNPLPWPRDGAVEVPWTGDPPTAIRASDGGDPIPAGLAGNALRFFARALPPMGYRTYIPAPGAPQPATEQPVANVIESPFFKATLDPARGAVKSLVDRRTGRELVDPSSDYALGQYLYERFDADQVAAYVKAHTKIKADWAVNELGKPVMPPAKEAPYRASSPANFDLRIERTATAITAILRAKDGGGVPHPVTMRLTLDLHRPLADIELTLHEKPADPWPEAGWMCLPLKVDAPRFRLGRLGSIVDPAADLVPGSNHDLFWLNSGLAVLDQSNAGVGLCPLDNPLVSLDRPGCWRYSPEFIPRKPAVFINLFNNQWTTNFRLWNGGTWTSRVRIWAIDRYDPADSLITPAWEARFPLRAAAADGPAGELPPSAPGVHLQRRGVTLTALGRNPDGPGRILRLWEMSGQSGPCTVTLPEGLRPRTVQPTDLRGRPSGTPIEVRNGQFTANLKPFAPATYLLP